MADFGSIQTALQGGPVGLILAAGLFVKLAATGVAQLIDAWTRRAWMKRRPVPIPVLERTMKADSARPPALGDVAD